MRPGRARMYYKTSSHLYSSSTYTRTLIFLFQTQTGLVGVINPKAIFYADVPEPLATTAADLLRSQSLLSMNTPSAQTYYDIAAYDNRRIYLHTTQDQALPPSAQDAFVAGSGAVWKVLKLDTSHSPFLSEPGRLAVLLIANTKDFIASYKDD